MSISTRFILPLLLSVAVAGVPIAASASPPQQPDWRQRQQFERQNQPGGQGGPRQGWQGDPRQGQGWQGGDRRGQRFHRGDRGDDGAGAAIGAGIIGLAVGAIAAGAANRRGGGDHVQWCLQRYRSYDPNTDTYRGNDGRRHYCR